MTIVSNRIAAALAGAALLAGLGSRVLRRRCRRRRVGRWRRRHQRRRRRFDRQRRDGRRRAVDRRIQRRQWRGQCFDCRRQRHECGGRRLGRRFQWRQRSAPASSDRRCGNGTEWRGRRVDRRRRWRQCRCRSRHREHQSAAADTIGAAARASAARALAALQRRYEWRPCRPQQLGNQAARLPGCRARNSPATSAAAPKCWPMRAAMTTISCRSATPSGA